MQLRSRSVPRMGSTNPVVAQNEPLVRVGQRGEHAELLQGVSASRSPLSPGTRARERARAPPVSRPVSTDDGALGSEFGDSPLDTPFEVLSEIREGSRSPSARGRTTDYHPMEGRTPMAEQPELRSWAQRVRDGVTTGQRYRTTVRTASPTSERGQDPHRVASPKTPVPEESMLKLSSTVITQKRT